MRVEASIEIDAPVEDVWGRVSDPSCYAQFMEGVRFAPVEGEPTTGPRARFNVWMQVGSAEIGGLIEVTEWDPPGELAWTSISGLEQRGRWRVRAADDGSWVWWRLSYQAPGGILALISDRVARPQVRGHMRRSLAGLKRFIEEG